MNQDEVLDELMICRLDEGRKAAEPCTIVIFGASGDLTARKLIPALYHLYADGLLPRPYRIIGFARREKTDDSFREELYEGFKKFSRTGDSKPEVWMEFAKCITYCRGSFDDPEAYAALKADIESSSDERLRQHVLFYLATSPSQFGQVVEQLSATGLLHKDHGSDTRRVVVEKPFGHDLPSARALNSELIQFAHERQLFRIDHYLGKETVQNIMIFRFSNAIFEQLWNRESIDHIQITVSEQHSVAGRGGYYEEAGALRDMVQNHLLQVMALIGMEPPVNLDSEAVRDEKVKFLQSIRPIEPSLVDKIVVRGQYSAGKLNGDARPAYRDEVKVAPDSRVETYAAMKLFVDNWRWSGVPFYLRTGKNLPLSASEVRIQFKPTPHVLFAAQCGANLDANSLTLRLQPNEGITLRINGKIPGASTQVRPVRMHFSYDSEFGAYTPEAYERLLIEAVAGNPTLFIRSDELETAWSIVDAIREGWGDRPLRDNEFYSAGSWGPTAADELLAARGHTWRNPSPAV